MSTVAVLLVADAAGPCTVRGEDKYHSNQRHGAK